LQGRWLQAGEAEAVALSQSILGKEFPDVGIGDTIHLSIRGRHSRWRVVGISEFLGHGGGMFVTEEGLLKATGLRQPNLLRIVTDGHDEIIRAEVAREVDRVLTEAGIAVRSSSSVSRSAAAGAGHMLPLVFVFLGLSVAIGVVGFTGLASTMSTNVLERTREFGVMNAIGATPSAVRRLVVLEGVFLSLVSCAVAALPAVALTALVMGNLSIPARLPFQLSWPGIAIWIAIALLGAAISTWGPATRASRSTVREALANL
jgi:putative ABC transport system permease protein